MLPVDGMIASGEDAVAPLNVRLVEGKHRFAQREAAVVVLGHCKEGEKEEKRFKSRRVCRPFERTFTQAAQLLTNASLEERERERELYPMQSDRTCKITVPRSA